MTKNAVALRAFTHAGSSFAKDQVILGIDPGHLADWSTDGVDLVREATTDEVKAAKAKDEKAPAASKRRSASAAPAAAAASENEGVPPVEQPDA